MWFQTLKDKLFGLLLVLDDNWDKVRIATAWHWCLLWKLSGDYALCFDDFLMQCVFEHECCFGDALGLSKWGYLAFVHCVVSVVVGHYHRRQFGTYSLIAIVILVFFRGNRIWARCK